MGYLFLLLALAAGLTKGFCGKSVSRDMETFKECAFINLLRLFFCAAVGAVLLTVRGGAAAFALTVEAVPIYLLAAFSMSVFCVCWMYAYRMQAYIFLNVFTMLGSIVTCIMDAVIYGTHIRLTQWCGIVILLAAVYIMSLYNKDIKGKLTLKGVLILVIGCLGSAFADFSQKMYVKNIGKSADTFNFYMYAFGTAMLLVLYLISHIGKPPKLSAKLYDKKHIGIYFAIAFFLYLNSMTKTMAAQTLTSAQLYPVLQGANLIMSALMAHILFKEKITKKSIVGMATAFAGIILLNLL